MNKLSPAMLAALRFFASNVTANNRDAYPQLVTIKALRKRLAHGIARRLYKVADCYKQHCLSQGAL